MKILHFEKTKSAAALASPPRNTDSTAGNDTRNTAPTQADPALDDDKPEPFPLDCLPPAAADMARAIAHTERTPETLAGCCVFGILSASIGAGLQVRSGPDRFTRGNLFLLVSAESGTGKSESFRHAARPFHEFEHEMVNHWLREIGPQLEADVAILEARIKQLTGQAGKAKDAIEREALRGEIKEAKAALVKAKLLNTAPALCCEDVTTERLAVLLQNNQEQLASLSPDAGSIVNNVLGRYSKQDRTDETIYLKAFSGDYCRVDRIGRETVLLLRPCLVALWLTQPDKVETLLAKKSLTDGGLIPRLLVSHTHAQPQPIVDGIEGIPADVANAWAKLVNVLLKTFRMATQPATIEPTPEARQLMKEHFNGIVERRLDDLHDVTTYAARWNEQAWRIAVCIHAGKHGEYAGERMMDLDTAQCAIRLADWFSGEQLRILAGGRHAAKTAKRDEVLGLLADNPAGITHRDVQRALHLPSAEEARALLAAMEAEGILIGKDSQPEKGGHLTRIYTKGRK